MIPYIGVAYTRGGGYYNGRTPLDEPPPPQTKVTIVGKSDWAIFGTPTFGSQDPPPSLSSNTSLGTPLGWWWWWLWSWWRR